MKPENEDLLDNKELKAKLRVCNSAIKDFRNREINPLPFLKAGRKYFYKRDKVEKWMEQEAKLSLHEQKSRK